jgi:DNA-binding transcriptional ArsR family regulator
MSAAELAREMDVSQGLASYHLRALVRAELVELAEQFSNRGGLERRYRHRVERPLRRENTVDDHEYASMIAALVAELERRQAARDSKGPALVTDAEL